MATLFLLLLPLPFLGPGAFPSFVSFFFFFFFFFFFCVVHIALLRSMSLSLLQIYRVFDLAAIGR